MTTDTRKPTRIQTEKKAAIMAAALDVFAEHGLRGATLDKIAAASGMTKQHILYYFGSKDAIYTALLGSLLQSWLQPLRDIAADGDPLEEILTYAHRKLRMSQEMPRESKLFATEILHGAPRTRDQLSGELKTLVDEKAAVIAGWRAAGKIADVDPYHLIFSVWAVTQHYADFDIQVRALLGAEDFEGAHAYLDQLFRRLLAP